jgi:uncharacterized protein
MRVLITGASGLIGSALTESLEAQGHRVTRVVRSAARDGEVRWDPTTGTIYTSQLNGHTAAIHLAGEPVAVRWTAAKKARILASRVQGTRLLSASLAELEQPPAVLVCASAIGFYGDRPGETLTEESVQGRGFLPQVVSAWEAAADPARAAGIRVVHLRFGIVLSGRGGALPRMLLPFRLGLGGPLGSGNQFVSWVALDDAVGAIIHAIEHDEVDRPLNVVSPRAVTSREFARALGRVLRRPAFCRVPACVIRLMLGEMGSELLLSSTHPIPDRLVASGFAFRYSNLDDALRHVLTSH